MSFIVIEGDNGVGKDTLAQSLEQYGFDIVSYKPEIKAYEKYAKESKGIEKVNRFLLYGKECSNQIKNSRYKDESPNLLLIRYWISTLAAAYSDKIFDYKKVMRLVDEIYPLYEQPDTLIRLSCNYETRIQRILGRNSHSFDDKTIERNDRYAWITEQIKNAVDIDWIEIETSNLTISQVRDKTVKILNLERRK